MGRGAISAGVLLAACALACAASCAREASVVEAPVDVERLAIARLVDGAWADGTGLLARTGTAGVIARRLAVAQGEAAIVVGWSGAALGEVPPDAALGDPVRSPGACETVLPPPSWAVSVDAEGEHALDPTTLPPLTTRWAADRCDDLALAAQVVCGENLALCPLRQVTRTGCRYQLDFDCELGPVALRRARGEVCMETPGCSASESAGDRLTFACAATCRTGDPACDPGQGGRPAACEVRATKSVPPARVADRVRLTTAAPRTPEADPSTELRPPQVHSGFLGAPVIVDARVVIPVHEWRDNYGCDRRRPTRIARVSTATTADIAWTDGPPCLSLLARDPRGPGFLGAYVVDDVMTVGRFDASGALAAQVSLTALPEPRFHVALVVGEDGTIALVYMPAGAFQTVMVTLDPDTLAVRAQHVEPGMFASSALITRDHRLIVADDWSDVVVWYDLALTTCIGSTQAHLLLDPPMNIGNVPVLGMTIGEPTRELLLAVNEQPAIHRIEDVCDAPVGPGELCLEEAGRCLAGQRRLALDRGAEPVSLVPWAARENSIAATAAVRPKQYQWSFEAAVVTYDARAAEFLPGIVMLGPGIARDAVVDGRGALWVTLPWSGELVKLGL